MNITNIPLDIIHNTYNFLTFKAIIQFNRTCKRFYTCFNEMPMHLKLAIPSLVQQNANTLWNNPEGNFIVDHNGLLSFLSFTQVTRRFFKWRNQDTINQRVNQVVEVTFQEICRLNQQGSLDKSTKGSRRLYVWVEASGLGKPLHIYCPAYYLANQILKSKQFANQAKINQAALLVKGQADEYEQIRTHYPHVKIQDEHEDEYFSDWFYRYHGKKEDKNELHDTVVWLFDEKLKEALFSQDKLA